MHRRAAIVSLVACVLPHRVDPDRPRRALPGVLVCAGHRLRLRAQLAELAPLWAVLGEPAQLVGAGPRISGTAAAAAPMSAAALRLRTAIHAHLGSWARIVAEERGIGTPADAVPAVVAWLGIQHEWIIGQPWVDDWAQNLGDLHGAAWAHAYPSRRRRLDIGACPSTSTDHQDGHCPGRVVAVVDADDALLPAQLTCTVCGTTWPPRTWAALGRQLDPDAPQWATTSQIAVLLAVPLRTVQRWAQAWPSDGGRPPRYDLASLPLTSETIMAHGMSQSG